jgi:exopolysaccharide biosynthesis polyprenyl glycosylphosphotransferase
MHTTEGAALRRGAGLSEAASTAVDGGRRHLVATGIVPTVGKRRGWLVRRVLVLADVLGLSLAFVATQSFFPSGGEIAHQTEVLVFVATLPAWIIVAKLYGLYDRDQARTDHSTVDDFVGIFQLASVGAWLLAACALLTASFDLQLRKVLLFWASAIVLVTCARAVGRTLVRRDARYLQNTVIVGAGAVGQLLGRKLLNHPEYGINVVGFVDAEPKDRRPDLEHLTLLGGPDRLPEIVRLYDVERVVIAFSNESQQETLDLIRSLKGSYVQVDVVPRLFELLSPQVSLYAVEGLPLVGLPPATLTRSERLVKRGVDIILSGLGLVLLTPFFALIALLIKLDSRGPVFFRQVRMGEGDRTFRIIKFRTMCADAEERKAEVAHLNKHACAGGDPRMFKIPDDPRVTRVGRFVRRYALDELPQLINVLKGEMSLVGPRPLILAEDQHVADWARSRLELKPGVTGLWQCLGSSAIPFEEMIRLDYLYVTSWSLWNDLKLMFQTIPALLHSPDPSRPSEEPACTAT